MISYNKISSNNIEKGIKLYTIIKCVISFILVASIVLCLVAIFFCSENITLEIISYVAVILSIVIVYILPVGKIKIQMDTVDDYKAKNEILNSTTTFGGGIYSRTVKVYSFI